MTNRQKKALPEKPASQAAIPPGDPQPKRQAGKMRLTGFAAIEYAEKQGLRLNKHPDAYVGPRVGLKVAEAAAIADEDPGLIWLDVDENEYYDGPPTDFEPEY